MRVTIYLMDAGLGITITLPADFIVFGQLIVTVLREEITDPPDEGGGVWSMISAAKMTW